MKKSNFVLSVKFNNGSVSELYNIGGLKEMAIEDAIKESFKMVERKIKENSYFSKYHARFWKDAKPYSLRYDITDSNGFITRGYKTIKEGLC